MQKQPSSGSAMLSDRLFFACQQSSLSSPIVLDPSLSDPHNGGQCAVLFACGGKKYVFKPRPGKTDWAWADFLQKMQWITDVPLPKAITPLSPREADYTIVPFVEGVQARSEDEIRTYYLRCGALLGLCMVLGSTDLHQENLIAHGDSPLLVDVETLLSGVTQDKTDRAVTFYDALLFSHLLPNWTLTDGKNVDAGALTVQGKNMPRLNGAYCPPFAYLSEILRGFRGVCQSMLCHRDAVLDALALFRGAALRKLLRPTDLYDRLCRQIAALPTEEEKRLSAARLRRAYARGGEIWMAQMEKVCQSETDALLRGDIPYFYSLAEEIHLRAMEGLVAKGYFALSPLDAAKRRLLALKMHHIDDQCRIIAQSLSAACPDVSPVEIHSAMDVFHLLESSAVDENPCSFLGLTTDDRGNAYFQSIGFGLYEGLMGVLVFYAALYEASGDASVRAAIEKRYRPYRERYILPDAPVYATPATLNLTNGLAGHIIGLGYISRCLKDPAYLRDAAALYTRFRFSDQMETDGDLYNGSAALLIALPQLMGQGMDEALARTARLLAAGVQNTAPSLTGYAHGAAGMALALAAAEEVTGDSHTEAILRLLRWENAQFDWQYLNWPALRDAEQTERHFMKGLCSGAPGVGLARMQMLILTRHEDIARICREDMDKSRAFLAVQKPLKRDTLCCGNASLTEALCTLSAKQSFIHPCPVLYHPLDTNDLPIGLFQGLAGVGYALARTLPASHSSLFVWEMQP